MVNRIQNRNPGYSDNIFKNPNIEQNTLNSIDGATALKLDQQLEIDTNPSSVNDSSFAEETTENLETSQDSSSHGVSIENASYIENNLDMGNKIDNLNADEDHDPKLFSDDIANNNVEEMDTQNEKLFDQNSSDDEEFEIPAFLRKQKF